MFIHFVKRPGSSFLEIFPGSIRHKDPKLRKVLRNGTARRMSMSSVQGCLTGLGQRSLICWLTGPMRSKLCNIKFVFFWMIAVFLLFSVVDFLKCGYVIFLCCSLFSNHHQGCTIYTEELDLFTKQVLSWIHRYTVQDIQWPNLQVMSRFRTIQISKQ